MSSKRLRKKIRQATIAIAQKAYQAKHSKKSETVSNELIHVVTPGSSNQAADAAGNQPSTSKGCITGLTSEQAQKTPDNPPCYSNVCDTGLSPKTSSNKDVTVMPLATRPLKVSIKKSRLSNAAKARAAKDLKSNTHGIKFTMPSTERKPRKRQPSMLRRRRAARASCLKAVEARRQKRETVNQNSQNPANPHLALSSEESSRFSSENGARSTAYQARLDLAKKVRYANKLATLVKPRPVPPEESVAKKPSTREAIELLESEFAEYRLKQLDKDVSMSDLIQQPSPSCIILRPKRKEAVAVEPVRVEPILTKRKRIQNYAALLNVDITNKSRKQGIKHSRKPCPRGKNQAQRSIQQAQCVQSLKNSKWCSGHESELSEAYYWNENESHCEVKEDDEIEIGDDDFVSEPVILEVGSFHANAYEEGSRCLICFNQDPNRPPLKGLLPKSRKLTNPEQLEDDLRIIYLLKMMFQWSSTELRYLMKLSNGQSPRDWIHLCQSCRLLIFEIQTLEDRMRDCRNKIKDKIMKTGEMSSSVPVSKGTLMTRRIRSLVNEQLRSAKANTVFVDGDRMAKELAESEMNRSVNFPYTDTDDDESVGYEQEKEVNEINNDDDDMALEDTISKPLEQFYICPYCPLENPDSSVVKMDFVEFYYHLIFHHDHPMKCTECQVFLPSNIPTLDAHWYQYHSDMTTISSKRYIEINMYSTVQANIKEENPTFPDKSHSSILCGDCLKEDIEIKFDSMKKFKIHQALKHPDIARSSCPLCSLVFAGDQQNSEENKIALMEHLKSVHKMKRKDCWRSYMCTFCGRGIQNDTKDKLTFYFTNFALPETLHMMSKHVQLIQAIYTCTLCSKEFSHFEKFVEHAKFSPDHSKITWDPGTKHLCHADKKKITCDLCIGDEPATFDSKNLHLFLFHINSQHSVAFEWKTESLKAKGIFTKSEVRIEEMTEVCGVLKGKEEQLKRKISLVSGNIKSCGTRPPNYKYACPACPHLKKMNLDAFLVHLIFHWRRPNRCTLCKSYLPFAPEASEEHWKQHHPDLNSSTEVKFETVQPTPGDLFRCEKCPEKFSSCRARNEHEQSTHGWCPARTNTCDTCDVSCTNANELRLHRAIDHPEVSSVSCYYCDQLFPADSVEGVKFLDCEALQHHSSDKEDHPKAKGRLLGVMVHLHACDFCGKVVEDSTKNSVRLRSHISQCHISSGSGSYALLSCFICDAKLRRASLWKHLSTSHAKNCICDTCGQEMRPWTLPVHNLAKHNILMEGYEQFRCKEDGCCFVTVYNRSLSHHVSVNHNKERTRKHKCSICEKAFFTSVHLREHEGRHRNKETRPFQCEICGGAYAARSDLYIHKRLSHLNLKFPSTNRKRSKATKRDPVSSIPRASDEATSDRQDINAISLQSPVID